MPAALSEFLNVGWAVGATCASRVDKPPHVHEGALGKVLVDFGEGRGRLQMHPSDEIGVPGRERVSQLEAQLALAREQLAAAQAGPSTLHSCGRCAGHGDTLMATPRRT